MTSTTIDNCLFCLTPLIVQDAYWYKICPNCPYELKLAFKQYSFAYNNLHYFISKNTLTDGLFNPIYKFLTLDNFKQQLDLILTFI